MATLLDASEANLMNSDQSMATAAITPASVGSGSSVAFLPPGTPVVSGLAGFAPLDDTPVGGDPSNPPDPTVPPDVFDKNFGPNYTIFYSREGVAGGAYFDGGIGSDQYTNAQGDLGNFGGIADNYTTTDEINIVNSVGGIGAEVQYQVYSEFSAGEFALGIQTAESWLVQTAAELPANAGGNPVKGAGELIASAGVLVPAGVTGIVGAGAVVAGAVASPGGLSGLGLGMGLLTISGGLGGMVMLGQGLAQSQDSMDNDEKTFLNDAGRGMAQAARDLGAFYGVESPGHPYSQFSPLSPTAPNALMALGGMMTPASNGGSPMLSIPSQPSHAAFLT